jgi:hypothetical protein
LRNYAFGFSSGLIELRQSPNIARVLIHEYSAVVSMEARRNPNLQHADEALSM